MQQLVSQLAPAREIGACGCLGDRLRIAKVVVLSFE
jgi:hypothetical protein